jgi:tRNA 5-methylaminomethyl-2-thiouridine biosynthesis bifunctional protein
LVFGATHDRDDAGADVRPRDTARNMAQLASRHAALASRLAAATLRDRASVRAAGPRQAPLAGEVAGRPGVFVLAGLGGRGFTLAPLLAEHLAAQALGAPSPLPADLAARIDPVHFADSRKGAGSETGPHRPTRTKP